MFPLWFILFLLDLFHNPPPLLAWSKGFLVSTEMFPPLVSLFCSIVVLLAVMGNPLFSYVVCSQRGVAHLWLLSPNPLFCEKAALLRLVHGIGLQFLVVDMLVVLDVHPLCVCLVQLKRKKIMCPNFGLCCGSDSSELCG